MKETFVERTAGDSTPTLRLTGSAAYEHAVYVIETSCWAVDASFWDSGNCDARKKADVDAAVQYLELRGLIERHREESNWISVRDESEATR